MDDISLASTRDAAGCIDSTALFLNGGHAQGDYLDGASFWDGLFRISKDELRTRSEWEQTAVESGAMVAAQRRYYWVNDPGEDWYQQPGFPGGPILGSPMHPVWILFGPDAECPPLGSELVIYGLVYYETGDSGQCDASGWGSVQVYGSVLVEGDLVMPGGGGSFMHYEYAEEQGLLAHLPPIRVARVPGTWRDF